jgi:hypothetical protein
MFDTGRHLQPSSLILSLRVRLCYCGEGGRYSRISYVQNFDRGAVFQKQRGLLGLPWVAKAPQPK